MAQFINAYEFDITGYDEATLHVALRLTVRSQLSLQKKYNNEAPADILFEAATDIERFVTVMSEALKWKAADNEKIKGGEELVDLMMLNGMLGVTERQQIVANLGLASGIFSTKEKAALDKAADDRLEALDKALSEGNSKN